MDDLREKLLEVEREYCNSEDELFASDESLYSIVTRHAVESALRDKSNVPNCKVEPHHVEPIMEAVMKGLRKIFSILVLIHHVKSISRFIENDQYKRSELDYNLPFDKKQLEDILPTQGLVHEFYERQWHFTVPVFLDSVFTRSLPPKTIMPFLKNEPIGGGGFGDVFHIDIELSHRSFERPELKDSALVRKVIKSGLKSKETFETELRNLSILKLLHHPNIIEVLGSYAYRGEVNLVFRRVEGGTLADLLENPPTPAFQSDKAFLKALSGLCSAVSIVHQHVSSKTDLEMIGCHHDLKPANILVENNEFVLADFGLSNLKDAEKDSDTPARAVHPYYSPPECWQPAGSSEKPIIHRSSDVWSLGCIIAEVVTYMLDGPQGITKFEQSRSFQDGIITRYRFHRGGKEEPAVTMWIKKMQNSASETIQMLGCLVYNTLQLEPRKRPSAHKIEQHMCFVVIHSLSSSICHLYEKVFVESQSIEAYLEQTRFMSWKYGCGLDDNYSFDIKLKGWKDIKRYRAVMESLTDIEKELNYVLAICQQSLSRIFRVLRQLNTLLIEDLPQDAQDRARTFLDVKMMASEHDLSLLANINVPEARRLAMLATVKTMTEVSKSREGKGGCIDRKRLKKVKRLEDFVIYRLEDSSGVDCGPVLIESRTYEEHQAEKRIATELYERLESITAQLKTANHSEGMDGFRVLPCAGFYQDPTAYSCGIIYHFPSQSANTTFTSLRSSLEISQRKPTLQPSLEARFELALALATSLRQFHKANWFQKSVSSFNIVFYHDDTASWLDGIKNPFFLGLLYSRSNDIKAFTEGPTEEASHRDFQHPEYRKNNLRFRAEYDYFSLGLVLLEIGLWQPLSQLAERRMKDGDKESSKPFMEYILQSCVPRLALTMGTRYRKVVQACLNGDFGPKVSSKDEVVRLTNIQLRFSDLVVETLAKCSV